MQTVATVSMWLKFDAVAPSGGLLWMANTADGARSAYCHLQCDTLKVACREDDGTGAPLFAFVTNSGLWGYRNQWCAC